MCVCVHTDAHTNPSRLFSDLIDKISLCLASEFNDKILVISYCML